jgi:dTMP kinase
LLKRLDGFTTLQAVADAAAFFCAMKRRRGIFITFEGIDGCGKTTQARRLSSALKRQGLPVVFLREPGGTPASERIRRVLLDRRLIITPLAELFLYEAARVQLAETVIIPALTKGMIVICDRYYDSTTAYQGYGRGLNGSFIDHLNRIASLGVAPDLTFVFDVDYRTSLSRRHKRPDRLEKENRRFFNRVRRGFQALAAEGRVVTLDGRRDIASLAAEVRAHSEPLIRRRITRRAR